MSGFLPDDFLSKHVYLELVRDRRHINGRGERARAVNPEF